MKIFYTHLLWGSIVDIRLRVSEHLADNSRVFNLILDATDVDLPSPIFEKSRDLHESIGDCGDKYRR